MLNLTICLIFLGILYSAECNCWGKHLKSELTDYGRAIHYCEYDYTHGQKYVSLKLLPGSQMKTTDCVTCMCTVGGLLCCTPKGKKQYMGQYLPFGCEMVVDGCEVYYVLSSDKTRDCYTGKPIWLQRFLQL